MSVYSEILMRHAKHPVANNPLLSDQVDQTDQTNQDENTPIFIEFRNRSCGDLVRLSWSINPKSQQIEKLSHYAEGCMLCKASASILCAEIQNRPLSEVKNILEKAAKATDFREELPDFSQTSSDFKALSEARQFPTRKRCFTLAWEAFQQGLNQTASSMKK